MHALVMGAGGFIGSHLVDRLKREGYKVTGVDLKFPEFDTSSADTFLIADLRDPKNLAKIFNDARMNPFDEVYQLAADMGGAGYIFTGDNDANIMHNSATINLNLLQSLISGLQTSAPKVFYSSSACVYPEENQTDPNNLNLEESSAYPANPDSEYGWEKLFSERLFQSFSRNYNIQIAIARFHNIFGPKGTWMGGKEKAPAAIARKIAELPKNGGEIEIWGDGLQTRSFLYIDDCIEAIRRLMASNFPGPINIGSEEMLTINEVVEAVSHIANKKVDVKHILNGPVGVRGRTSSNQLIRDVLGWDYEVSFRQGMSITYSWIEEKVIASVDAN